MIVLFTDFGNRGPYVGQMKAVLAQQAPGQALIDLMHDAPQFNPRAAAYLLAAYVDEFPLHTVFLCVVDPGVGNPERKPVMMQADGRWYVGPDNGLLELIAQRADTAQWHEITWQPPRLSASFHGRDLFAPVAASLARGLLPEHTPCLERPAFNGPADLAEVIYIDAFGNAMTGLRASGLSSKTRLKVNAQVFARATTFSDVPPGSGFWYANANGLAELAVNRGRADLHFGLNIGSTVLIQ